MSLHTILYVHGMGGGGDSRIPSILKESLGTDYNVVIRTYDFDPEIAHTQITTWAKEVQPDLVIGESMGSIHAVALTGYPHILVSPSLNAPLYFQALAVLVLLPGMTALFDKIFHPREGDRQPLHFTRRVLLKWKKYYEYAKAASPMKGGKDYYYAFFGTKDNYRKSGVVRVGTWKKWYGESTYTIYDGTHYMEEEYLHSLLIPKIKEVLGS